MPPSPNIGGMCPPCPIGIDAPGQDTEQNFSCLGRLILKWSGIKTYAYVLFTLVSLVTSAKHQLICILNPGFHPMQRTTLVCLCGSLAQCTLTLKRLSAGPGFNPQTRQNKLFLSPADRNVLILMFVGLHSCHKEMTSSGQLLSNSSLVLNSSKSRRVSSINILSATVNDDKFKNFNKMWTWIFQSLVNSAYRYQSIGRERSISGLAE